MRLIQIQALLVGLLIAVSFPALAKEGDAQFAVSPESAYSLLDPTLKSARESVMLNIYMLTNRNITQTLADLAQKGVQVTVLIEGETFGGEILAPVKKVLDDLYLRFDQQSSGRGKLLVMTSQDKKVSRRFVFDHAKYAVIDGKKVFISSENFTGAAFANKNVTGGTRGWQIYLESASVAQDLAQKFQSDTDPSNSDIVDYAKAPFHVKNPTEDKLPPRVPRDVPSFSVASGRFQNAQVCASPGSLSCILDFIQSAQSELRVEHLSLPTYWKSGEKKVNPIVDALLAAARRGVKVRVLLNDDAAFGGEDLGGVPLEDKNVATVQYLQAQASKQGLPLEAKLFSPNAVEVNYLHNKGMVADGRRAFISSINGTQNAVENNREIGVAVDSADAARFYGSVFDTDWNLSK